MSIVEEDRRIFEEPEPRLGAAAVSERGMAAWLLRAIVMENIAIRAAGTTLEPPAGPSSR